MAYCLYFRKAGLHLVCIIWYISHGVTRTVVDGQQLSSGSPGVCTTVTSKVHSYQASYTTNVTIRRTRACGFFDWRTCTYYSLEPSTVYRVAYRKVYSENYTCCDGWEETSNGECNKLPVMEDPMANPCTEGLLDCKARNFTSCVATQSKPNDLSYICQNCIAGLTEIRGICVDMDGIQLNGTAIPSGSSSHNLQSYLIPVLVIAILLVITIIILTLICIKCRLKKGEILTPHETAKPKEADPETKAEPCKPTGKLHEGEAKAPSAVRNKYEYADLELYLEPKERDNRYTQLHKDKQGSNSLEKRPPRRAPGLARTPSEEKYEYVSYKSMKDKPKPKSVPGTSAPIYNCPRGSPSQDKDPTRQENPGDGYEGLKRESAPYVDMEGNRNTPCVYEPMDGPDDSRASYLSVIP